MKKLLIVAAGALPLMVGTVQADQVILDDLIVDGSACIGLDCVNGESFDFDTLRLKENNLRLHFNDTSASASFPGNDWRIQINDSANGGANYFAVEDTTAGTIPFRVLAGAGNNALYVNASGDVGLGTATPVVELHVTDGDTATLRLEQDGSSGFTPQTWDVAGNEANFFVRDATNGSTLPFKIFPSAPTNALTIEGTTGDVGLGTQSPDSNLDIEDATPELRLTGTTSGTFWEMRVNGAGNLNIQANDSGNNALSISPLANANLMRIGRVATDQVDITGNLVVSGTITPDYVFEPVYKLETIEEHAAFMWTNKHLPAVSKATPDGKGTHSINISQRAQGVLEELEKAHIYIERLNQQVQALQSRLDKMQDKPKT